MFDKLSSVLTDTITAIYDNLINIAAGMAIFLIFLILRNRLSQYIGQICEKLFSKNPVARSGIRSSIQGPLKAFFLILGVYWGLSVAGLPPGLMNILVKLFRISNILLITWALTNFTPFATSMLIKLDGKSDRRSNAVAIKFVANVMKVIIIALSVVVVISELGYNISGLITGIGLSGLTFSLAAQSTAADLFAGFSIVTDKPFDVGDYISTPSVEGIIEDITMRSTRVRTIADTLVVVPNSKLINESITNRSKMNKRYVDMTIGLTYAAESDTLKSCVADIEDMLRNHEDVDNDRIVVAFSEFASSSQDIRIIYFTNTTVHDEYIKVREDVNYKIKEIVEKNGASFAFPSTSVYMETSE